MSTSPSLSAAAPLVPPHACASRMGALLLEAGKISPEQLEQVAGMQQELGMRFGAAAVCLGLASEADIAQALARQFDYPYVRRGEAALAPQLVAAYQPFGPQAEALRAVRSELMLRWFARGHRALALVGADPGDGVSLFAANLALVFAQLGAPSVLVEANLRNPRQHQLFGIKARAGLSDILAGRAGLEVVAPIPDFPGLSVLLAGTLPPNPQELLSRDSCALLGAELERRYQVVLYELPPFARGVDALAVAGRAGGVLLVARKHHTRLASVSRMAAQLALAGAEVVGSVVVEF
ncbi:MAG: chain length determinant protein tyrosine kinase EpsG [Pseudomonadota bacterium]